MTCYRLNRSRYSPRDATGAALHGGRWNSPGIPVLYASSTLSLACLEILVHTGGVILVPTDYVSSAIYVPNELVESWSWLPLPGEHRERRIALFESEVLSREFGDLWVRDRGVTQLSYSKGRLVETRREKPVLEVPSVVIPSEMNYVINPNHPEFSRLKWEDPLPFRFDPRLVPADE